MLFFSTTAASLIALARTESNASLRSVARTESTASLQSVARAEVPVVANRGFFGNLYNAPFELAATPGAVQEAAKKASGTLEHVNVKTLPAIDKTLVDYNKLAIDASKLATDTSRTVDQLGRNGEAAAREVAKLSKTADLGIKVIAGSAGVAAVAATGAAISTAVSNNKDSKKISKLEKLLLEKENQSPNTLQNSGLNNALTPQVAPSVGVLKVN